MSDDLNQRIIADQITDAIGSAKFIVFQTIFLFVYLLWQISLPTFWKFDPYPFILLNLILSFHFKLVTRGRSFYGHKTVLRSATGN